MAEPSVTIESPNIQVDAPVNVGLKGITEDISNRFRELVDAVKSGDDEVMAALFLGVAFVVAGVFVWRRW